MNQRLDAKTLWTAARKWLEENSPSEVTNKELKRYFDHPPISDRSDDIASLYRHILKSLTQAGMTENVIVGSMKNGIDSLGLVTYRFSPVKTLKRYGNDHDALFADVGQKIRPTGQLREEGLWPKYCKTVLSSAKFLSQFDTAVDFFKWADAISDEPRSRVALPLILSHEIFGAGFALACNVLIDLGYERFAKPDRHVRSILIQTGLLAHDANDYQALKILIELADRAKVTPYALDKALFLIGSGRYFLHPDAKAQGVRDRTERFLASLAAA